MSAKAIPVINTEDADSFDVLNIKELILIDKELAELNHKIETLEKRRLGIEEDLKNFFINNGVRDIRTDTNVRLKLKREIFASKIGGCDMPYFLSRMKDVGLSDFIKETFNPSQFSAWLRERERQTGKVLHDNWDEILPEELKGLVNVYEKVTISTLGIQTEE